MTESTHRGPRRGEVGGIWSRPSRDRSETADTLTRERIVREAIALLDAEGIARLTMRRLADRLGTGPTTLYWHVETKDDVLDLALDAIFGEIAYPSPGAWRAEITAFAWQHYRVLSRHPWSASLLGARPLMGPNALARSEFLQASLVRAGFRWPDVTAAAYGLSNYVIGCVATRASWRRQEREDLWHGAQRRLREQADHYPTLAANLDLLDDDWDTSFGRGLEYLLDGLETPSDASRAST